MSENIKWKLVLRKAENEIDEWMKTNKLPDTTLTYEFLLDELETNKNVVWDNALADKVRNKLFDRVKSVVQRVRRFD